MFVGRAQASTSTSGVSSLFLIPFDMGLKMSESAKPYFAMICLQFGYAGMNLVTKVVLDRGMSHYVLVAYRNAFATAAIAPFALLSER